MLITLIVTTITASGRSDVAMAASLREAAVARAAVDGAADEAIFRVADGEWGHGPDTRILRIGDAAVQVQVEDDSGKVNLNAMPPRMMVALLQQVGVPPPTAASLAAAIADFRGGGDDRARTGRRRRNTPRPGFRMAPPHQSYRTVDELAGVLGMTPDILARLAPHVSAPRPVGWTWPRRTRWWRRPSRAPGRMAATRHPCWGRR